MRRVRASGAPWARGSGRNPSAGRCATGQWGPAFRSVRENGTIHLKAGSEWGEGQGPVLHAPCRSNRSVRAGALSPPIKLERSTETNDDVSWHE